ncbi:Sulfatase domain-containing protein [Fusarium falciforme]|uniref:Sulfatase domain-containing protein n=1 Tax=Fusarium falciforme TaxID=195108 RepID=UPI0023008AB1|nr:Sulfatase domain-containing protein [Fusarium falciforme]WAO96514.1 Sulfatase domain-containing protein [Fusarium falciforme]
MLRISAVSFETPLRVALTLFSRFANRKFFFTFAALAVWNAKITHIHAHLSAVPAHQLRQWGYSFFAQDVAILVLIRLLLDRWVVGLAFVSRLAIYFLTSIIILYNAALGIIAVSFYLVAGSEIHLRNVSLPTDPSSRALILSGSLSFTAVLSLTLLFSWLLQDFCYSFWGYAADVANWPFATTLRLFRRIRPQSAYSQIPQLDIEDPAKFVYDDESFSSSIFDDDAQRQTLSVPLRLAQRLIERLGLDIAPSKLKSFLNISTYTLVTIALLALVFSAFARPHDRSLIFLSWTTALLPFVDFSASSPMLEQLPSVFGTGIQRTWDHRTALADPAPLDWLPKDNMLAGFEDWYSGREHYSTNADPLKISNLDDDVLSELRDKLQHVPVKHVLLFFLESTRNDVFPIKKDTVLYDRLVDSFPDKKLPKEAMDRLATLTPTANYITGDYDDGFERDEASKIKRGGLRFTNAHTTGTYTLKSLVGTLCGVAPLMADFNLDYRHHVYQPCLAQVFEALNKLGGSEEEDAHPYNASKWQSYYYQAATMLYDKQYELVSGLGFPQEHIISREYLRSPNATHGPVTLPNINAFAFEEDPLEDYFRDVFVSAKEKDERVFLTHLTSTSHHAFKMPEHEQYVPVANGLDMLSHYVNSEGYDDKWLRKVLDLLDEQGVANETLIVFVGDHGLSMPENDVVSPYYNPNVGIDHVPLVFSHPLLPAFDVHDAVHSSQIVPTILDLLVETGSLNKASRQAATDMMRNYEGQSLIRPMQKFNNETGQGNWQFTVVNPGRAVVTARDARYPERHLVVPIIDNVEWRLSNLTADPAEHDSVQGFDFISFLGSVERKHGTEVAHWVEEGAFISRWWVEENSKRWRFGAYSDREP